MPRRSLNTTVDGIRVKRVTKKKLTEAKTPGEIKHKQQLFVYMKAAGFSHSKIGEALGERRGTIKDWANDPKIVKQYESLLESLATAGKQYLETLIFKAVRVLDELLDDEDPQIRLAALKEVLDRAGMPKLSRSERKSEVPADQENRIAAKAAQRLSTPEAAERISSAVAEAEAILAAEEGKQ